jgi:hypothetical protein
MQIIVFNWGKPFGWVTGKVNSYSLEPGGTLHEFNFHALAAVRGMGTLIANDIVLNPDQKICLARMQWALVTDTAKLETFGITGTACRFGPGFLVSIKKRPFKRVTVTDLTEGEKLAEVESVKEKSARGEVGARGEVVVEVSEEKSVCGKVTVMVREDKSVCVEEEA